MAVQVLNRAERLEAFMQAEETLAEAEEKSRRHFGGRVLRYQADSPDHGSSDNSELLAQIIEAMLQTPQMQWVTKMMQGSLDGIPDNGGGDAAPEQFRRRGQVHRYQADDGVPSAELIEKVLEMLAEQPDLLAQVLKRYPAATEKALAILFKQPKAVPAEPRKEGNRRTNSEGQDWQTSPSVDNAHFWEERERDDLAAPVRSENDEFNRAMHAPARMGYSRASQLDRDWENRQAHSKARTIAEARAMRGEKVNYEEVAALCGAT